MYGNEEELAAMYTYYNGTFQTSVKCFKIRTHTAIICWPINFTLSHLIFIIIL